jgi:hypothetical protein
MDEGWQLVDTRMGSALAEPVESLVRVLDGMSLARRDFWSHVIPLSATIDSNRQLAEVILRKLVGSSRLTQISTEPLVGAMTDLERAAVRAVPELLDELQLRSGPLREQWEARGPGLLTLIGQKTDEQLIPASAQVVLVSPVLGGGGKAHLPYNSASLEAVLINPHPQLPEVLRLGWMLAQLNHDLPVHSELIHRRSLPWISQLAMLPPTLLAAEELELARFDPPTMQLAIRAWGIATAESIAAGPAAARAEPTPASQSPAALADADLVSIVSAWWETYCASRTAWGVALAALDRMLESP